MNSNYEIFTYQVPVPIGDCSVHLLAESNGSVVNAIVMDGGTNADGIAACTRIIQAIKAIKSCHLGWDGRFDAWVVTHWDEDHYAGMVDYINGNKMLWKKQPTLYCGAEKPDKVKLTLPKAYYPGKKVVGLDLFTGEDPKISFSAGKPVFVCICAGGHALTNGKVTQIKAKPTANETSIIALIQWPAGHYSYYCGGDGFPYAAENYVVPLVQGSKSEVVTVAKLDHHGSFGEFKLSVIQGMSPCKVIVTPGPHYGHPSWKVIVDLYGYLSQRPYPEREFLYSTRTPYWANKPGLGKTDINTKINTKQSPFFSNIYKNANTSDIGSEPSSDSEYGQFDRLGDTIRAIQHPEFVPNIDPRLYQTKVLKTTDFGHKGLETSMVEKLLKENKGDSNSELTDRENDEDSQDRDDIVDTDVEIWNNMSPQRILRGNTERFYMLRLCSTNDKKTDGVITFEEVE